MGELVRRQECRKEKGRANKQEQRSRRRFRNQGARRGDAEKNQSGKVSTAKRGGLMKQERRGGSPIADQSCIQVARDNTEIRKAQKRKGGAWEVRTANDPLERRERPVEG